MFTLIQGEWSLYRGGQFKGGSGHVTEVVTNGRENGHVTEVSIMEGEWSCYGGGQFKGGRMVMLQRSSLMEGEWSFYRSGQFNGRSMVMLQRWPL